jgi:hypothetical protein
VKETRAPPSGRFSAQMRPPCASTSPRAIAGPTTGGKDNAPPPAFARKGPQLGTSDISPNRQMQFTYHLPAGEYAILDFNHDMKTGRPDTLEGMYAVVTLR